MTTQINQERAEAFGEKMLATLNAGALCLMLSVGHRTGLLDTLAESGSMTVEALAERAGRNERYVREWLGAMVAAGIVELDGASRCYTLPAEHGALLTRSGELGNMAVFAQYIPVLGAVEDDIVACFENGGGVPYDRYPRFHDVMAEDSAQTVLSALDAHILPLVPGLTERLEQGIEVLDVGCGAGRAVVQLARRFPASTFTGLDLSEDAIHLATEHADRSGVRNARFEIQDLSRFDREARPESYDLITAFDAIHDQGNPLAVLKGIHRGLRPDGVYLMQDIRGSSDHLHDREHPVGTFLYTISCLHCMTVSLAQGGAGLGAMWGEAQARELIAQAGFGSIETHTLEHDFQNNFYIVRKG